jgi:hypothetical protein
MKFLIPLFRLSQHVLQCRNAGHKLQEQVLENHEMDEASSFLYITDQPCCEIPGSAINKKNKTRTFMQLSYKSLRTIDHSYCDLNSDALSLFNSGISNETSFSFISVATKRKCKAEE